LLLLLVADEHLSYEQVATLTDQTADAVRGKLHRARKAFAALFEKTSGDVPAHTRSGSVS
jgi:DNA-directed RNA polymerase specialized sigma24 family protein